MSGSLNSVEIIGNLGADPEIRSFSNGGQVANLRLATSESWKDKATGEKQERTEWHSVAVFNEGLVGVIERYVKKGDKIYIRGQLQTRKWQDQEGNDRYSTEIVLRGFEGKLVMLSGGNGAGTHQGNQASAGAGASAGGAAGGARGAAAYPDLDDDIPF